VGIERRGESRILSSIIEGRKKERNDIIDYVT